MTYWATLWYAGSVILTIGYEGQTLDQCNFLGQQMMYDISYAYMDEDTAKELSTTVFPTDEFSFTCEEKRLPIDERYLK